MPTLQEVQSAPANKQSSEYHGPTTFEGYQIPQEVSPRITVRHIIRQLERSGFASVNIVGIPGSGKSECANMIAHLIHTERPEFTVVWCGSNELRHIKEYLHSLRKGQSYIIIFDDTSNALDSLSGEELSEAFQSYTRGRHEVQGKICPIMIYHYTKSHKKNFRAMAMFNIYLSSTPTEKGNIKELIRGDNNAANRFKQFQRLFRMSFAEKYFDLDLGNGLQESYEDSNPFRISYVLGPLGANLMLTKIMKCGLCSEKPLERFIDIDELLAMGKKSYPQTYNEALSLIAFMRGEKGAIRNELRKTLDFYLRVLTEANTDYKGLSKATQLDRKKKNEKRYYRPRKQEDENFEEISKKMTRKIVDHRPIEIRILEGLDALNP